MDTGWLSVNLQAEIRRRYSSIVGRGVSFALPAYAGAKEEGSIGPIQRPIISVCAVRKDPQVVQREGNVGEGDDLVQAQRDDPELALLIHLKHFSDDNSAKIQQNTALKKYSSVWDQLQLQDQRLVRVPPPYSDAASKVQVVLPKALAASVLNHLHSSVTGGHLGIQKLQETEIVLRLDVMLNVGYQEQFLSARTSAPLVLPQEGAESSCTSQRVADQLEHQSEVPLGASWVHQRAPVLPRNLEGPREGSASVSAGPRQRPVHEPDIQEKDQDRLQDGPIVVMHQPKLQRPV
ncbi:hypothetical protein DPX16_4910 [Anabarilius grahami]|uniref:Integrase zinc-binding domain-containing protein n=1 Tax=Anabarilius grahami TaxID=495550 RepID=A0A3N0XTT2_ANAGA|nr:hypothetical protein DPX16_4910 [Anabarilius grahami]